MTVESTIIYRKIEFPRNSHYNTICETNVVIFCIFTGFLSEPLWDIICNQIQIVLVPFTNVQLRQFETIVNKLKLMAKGVSN